MNQNLHYQKQKYPDLTRTSGCERSVSNQFEHLIQTIDSYQHDLQGLKNEFLQIIDDEKTIVSKTKAAEYKYNISQIYNVRSLQNYIVNVYCKGANL